MSATSQFVRLLLVPGYIFLTHGSFGPLPRDLHANFVASDLQARLRRATSGRKVGQIWRKLLKRKRKTQTTTGTQTFSAMSSGLNSGWTS